MIEISTVAADAAPSKPYVPPAVSDLGSLAELTQGGAGSSADFSFGASGSGGSI